MTAKEYLQQFRDLGLRIKNLREEIEAIEAERDSITVELDGLPRGSGKTGDKAGQIAARLADKLGGMQEALQVMNTQYWNRRQLIMRQIDELDDAVSARILKLRYVSGYTWEQIAVDLDKTYQWTCVLHGRALQEFDKKFHKVYNT